MASLEDLVARIRLDTSGLRAGLSQASSAMAGAGSTMSSAGRKMTTGLTLPLVGAGVASVKLAADFDKNMRLVGIASGAPVGPLKELALQMGAKTAFSAGEASEAMLELAKGGMTAVQIQGGGIQATMKLAAAGNVDLASASTYVGNAMQAFGLRARDANSVTVALAGAANASSASVESLGQGLSQVSLVAHNAGLSLQETTGVLSLFDSQGLKGSDAGTSLKAMLNSLIPTTTKAKGVMSDLGLQFVDSEGNFKSVANIAEQLRTKTQGLTQAQRAQTLETLFGSDGQRAAAILMNGGAKAVEKYTAASRDSATTNKLANAAMQGMSGAIERAKGSLETAAIVIGTALAPAVEKVAGFVESAANAFGELPGPVMTGVLVVGALVAALGPILMIAGGIASGMAAVAGAMAAISLPVVAVVAALVLLGAALVIAYQRSATFRALVAQAMQAVGDTIRNNIIPAAKGIATAFQGLVGAVLPIVMQLVGVFRQNLPQIRAVVQQVFSTLKTIVLTAMLAIRTVITVAMVVITALWRVFGRSIMGVVRGVFPAIIQVIRGALNIIQGVVRVFGAVLRGNWSGVWRGIQQILRGAGQVLAGIMRAAMALLRGIVSAAWAAIRALFSGGVRGAVAVARGLPGAARGAISALGGLLRGVATAAWNGLKSAFSNGVSGAVSLARSLPGKIAGVLSGLGGMLFGAGASLISGFVSGIQSKIGAAISAVQSGLSKIRGLLPGSPIKWGPLKDWNNTGPGGPGGRLMGLLADGLRNTAPVDAAMKAVSGSLSAGLSPSIGVSVPPPAPWSGRTDGSASAQVAVRVFIGDRELTDLVRVEVGDTLAPLSRLTRQGAI
jgi:TP901 family phage tail tape measure protein